MVLDRAPMRRTVPTNPPTRWYRQGGWGARTEDPDTEIVHDVLYAEPEADSDRARKNGKSIEFNSCGGK